MDLYGKPVQNIYSTILHLSSTINNIGSIVYDGRGNPSIISLSTGSCRLSGNVVVNNIDFNLRNVISAQTPLTSTAVLSLNRATSAVEIHATSTLLPPLQRSIFLPTVFIPITGTSADIPGYREEYEATIEEYLENITEPKIDDEAIITQKFYLSGGLLDIMYDTYRYTADGWLYITTI